MCTPPKKCAPLVTPEENPYTSISRIHPADHIWFSRFAWGILIEWDSESVRQCVGKRRSRTLQRARSRPKTLKPREDIGACIFKRKNHGDIIIHLGQHFRVRAYISPQKKLCGFGQYASRASFFVVVRLWTRKTQFEKNSSKLGKFRKFRLFERMGTGFCT